MSSFSLNCFLVLFLINTISGQIDSPPPNYYCDLHWASEGFGNVPPNSIQSGASDFVAKVNFAEESEWRLGRLLPSEGKALFVYLSADGERSVLESETYEVLTNPDNCVLEWREEVGGNVPEYAVFADKEATEFVGRSAVAGIIMAGTLIPTESAVLIPYEGKVYPKRRYEVLTSRYPKLNLILTDFYFPVLDYRVLEAKSRKTLVGQMEVLTETKPLPNINLEVTQPITHNKNVKEVFQIAERFGWEGVANVTLEMDLWVGSPTIETTFFSVSPDSELVFKRSREIIIDRVLKTTATAVGGAVVAESEAHSMQVCSVVTMLSERQGIKFEAMALVSSPGMRADQVKEILIRTGRKLLDPLDLDEFDGNVVAKVYGTLKGRFATRSASIYSSLDSNGACTSVLSH